MGNEITKIRDGNIGVDDPLGDEIVVAVGVGRVSTREALEVEILESGKAFNGGWGTVGGGDILLIKLPELFDTGTFSRRNGLKHAGKGREAGETRRRGRGVGMVQRRNGSWAGKAWESSIELVAVGGDWGGPRGWGRSEGRGGSGGGVEMREGGCARGEELPGRWNDGGPWKRSGRRKAQGGTGGKHRCGKAGTQEVVWNRRTKTMGRSTPDIDKPLGKWEGFVGDVGEERTIAVMPDFREPPRGNEGGEGGKKRVERNLEE